MDGSVAGAPRRAIAALAGVLSLGDANMASMAGDGDRGVQVCRTPRSPSPAIDVMLASPTGNTPASAAIARRGAPATLPSVQQCDRGERKCCAMQTAIMCEGVPPMIRLLHMLPSWPVGRWEHGILGHPGSSEGDLGPASRSIGRRCHGRRPAKGMEGIGGGLEAEGRPRCSFGCGFHWALSDAWPRGDVKTLRRSK